MFQNTQFMHIRDRHAVLILKTHTHKDTRHNLYNVHTQHMHTQAHTQTDEQLRRATQHMQLSGYTNRPVDCTMLAKQIEGERVAGV